MMIKPIRSRRRSSKTQVRIPAVLMDSLVCVAQHFLSGATPAKHDVISEEWHVHPVLAPAVGWCTAGLSEAARDEFLRTHEQRLRGTHRGPEDVVGSVRFALAAADSAASKEERPV